MKDKITLWCPDGIGVIIQMESGVVWHHQTNGVMCNQVYIEGVCIPWAEELETRERRPRLIDDWFDYLDTENGRNETKVSIKPKSCRNYLCIKDENGHSMHYHGLLEELVHINEHGHYEDNKCHEDRFQHEEELWKLIKEKLGVDWKVTDPPSEDFPSNQEALQWVKITKVPPYDEFKSYSNFEPLIGKVVALYYPNCD